MTKAFVPFLLKSRRYVTRTFGSMHIAALSFAVGLAGCGGGSEPTAPEIQVESPESLQCKANLETQSKRPNAIENSYIVSFKPSTPTQLSPIWPAVKRDAILPLDQPSSGQSKEQLAAELGIRGKVVHILDNINAAVLQIDAAEAGRLCADPRVKYVEQDMWTTAV